VHEVVGLVPMAGQATRMSPLPMSKELFPISMQPTPSGLRPRVASHDLLESMRGAGIRRAFLVLRPGKWDIPGYYGDGAALLDMDLAYLVARFAYGPPYSLDAAYPFVRNAVVATGFPDILFTPAGAFGAILERQSRTQADVVLALFPWNQPTPEDMVDVDENGIVRAITLRQAMPGLRYTWVLAVWSPAFTEFMHSYLESCTRSGEALRQELTLTHVMRAALSDGLRVEGVGFPDGEFLDIGTPEGLIAARQRRP
jgi:glucose-1-phosphate thymidylyltransferase